MLPNMLLKSSSSWGKVVTLSDSSGFIYDPEGISKDKLDWVIDLKNNKEEELKNMLKNLVVSTLRAYSMGH